MSPARTDKMDARQLRLYIAMRDAEKSKQKNMKAATEPMGLCLIITVFMLAIIIAPPIAIVLL